MDFKDVATMISLLFAAVALWRNLKSDTRDDGARVSEILVKMEVMQSDLKEIKADFKAEMKAIRADLEGLKDRVTVTEQSVKSAHKRIDNMQHVEGRE